MFLRGLKEQIVNEMFKERRCKMKKKILTVLVCAYNSEKYLEQCLNSITNDEIRAHIDCIVVNDGSKDRTGEIADKYARMYPDDVRVIYSNDCGQGAAYNKGIINGVGKYIMFADADDFLLKEDMIQFLGKLPSIDADIIGHSMLKTYGGNKGEIVGSDLESEREYDYRDVYIRFPLLIHQVVFNLAFIKSNSILGDTHYKISGDAAFCYRAGCYAEKVYMTHDVIYGYRINNEQASSIKTWYSHGKDQFDLGKSIMETFLKYREMEYFSSSDRISILRKLTTDFVGYGYLGAIFIPDTQDRIEELNELMRKDKELWNMGSLKLKIVRTNLCILFPFIKYYLSISYKRFKRIKSTAEV